MVFVWILAVGVESLTPRICRSEPQKCRWKGSCSGSISNFDVFLKKEMVSHQNSIDSSIFMKYLTHSLACSILFHLRKMVSFGLYGVSFFDVPWR